MSRQSEEAIQREFQHLSVLAANGRLGTWQRVKRWQLLLKRRYKTQKADNQAVSARRKK